MQKLMVAALAACVLTASRLVFDFDDRVDFAQFLHDGSGVKLVRRPYCQGSVCITRGKDVCDFVLPMVKPDMECPAIEVFLK